MTADASTTAPTTKRLALATYAELPDLDTDDQPLVAALAARGITAEPAVWNDPDVDWSSYDVVVLRSTWDYTEHPEKFLAWTREVEKVSRLLNPAEVIQWNHDKVYLRDLQKAGLPIVPTIWLDPERNFDARAVHTRFPAFGRFVIKPTVSAGSRDTGRYDAGETTSRAQAITHAKNLLSDGRHVMVQHYFEQVDRIGETAVIFVEGRFSHAVRKDALLAGPYRPDDRAYKPETMTPREATAAEREVAQRVVDAIPQVVPGADGALLYARVDLLPDDDGNPVVLELELTEPSLFMGLAPGALDRFADAIAARV